MSDFESGSWWARPERLAWEVDQLRKAGVEILESGDPKDPGIFRIRFEIDSGGTPLVLRAEFPPLFPFFRPLVFLESDLELTHHFNPLDRQLCLLGRRTADWSASLSVLELVELQLPKLIACNSSSDPAELDETLEVPQAEPFSAYYGFEPGSMILIDGSWQLPEGFERGRVTIRYQKKEGKFFRGIVTKVTDQAGRVELHASGPMADNVWLDRLCPDEISGDVVALEEPLPEQNPSAFEVQLRSSKIKARWQGPNYCKRSVLAAVFPEEHSWRNLGGQGWIFVVGTRRGSRSKPESVFVRAGRAGTSDLKSRAPELASVSDKTISMVGLGSLGAPSSIEFARAGVKELRLVDGDYLEPGTTLRWPLGLPWSGVQKTSALYKFITANYPQTVLKAADYTIGKLSDGEEKFLDSLVSETSLIFDATAEFGVSYFLSELAGRIGIPFVSVAGTQGGWGGYIYSYLPGENVGCWWCLNNELTEKRIPMPPADPDGEIQPAGCADPTFTGAGFDMSFIALSAVRQAISMLSGQHDPRRAFLRISLRDESGNSITPKFESFPVLPSRDCKRCNGRQSLSG